MRTANRKRDGNTRMVAETNRNRMNREERNGIITADAGSRKLLESSRSFRPVATAPQYRFYWLDGKAAIGRL